MLNTGSIKSSKLFVSLAVILLFLISVFVYFNGLNKNSIKDNTQTTSVDTRSQTEIMADTIASTNRNGMNLSQTEKDSIISGINSKSPKSKKINPAQQVEILDKINKSFQNSN